MVETCSCRVDPNPSELIDDLYPTQLILKALMDAIQQATSLVSVNPNQLKRLQSELSSYHLLGHLPPITCLNLPSITSTLLPPISTEQQFIVDAGNMW